MPARRPTMVRRRSLGAWYDFLLPIPAPVQIVRAATSSAADDAWNAAVRGAIALPGTIANVAYSAATGKPDPSTVAAIKQQTCQDIINAGGSQSDCQQANSEIDVTIASSGPPQTQNPALWLGVAGLALLALVAIS